MNADAIKVREIQVKSILSTSNLPVADYSVNPYVGCPHACKYCYAAVMKRFTGHPEPWGTFLDVKYWPEIRNPGKYAGNQLFIGSVTAPNGPQEEIYKRTRALLEQLQGSGCRPMQPAQSIKNPEQCNIRYFREHRRYVVLAIQKLPIKPSGALLASFDGYTRFNRQNLP